MLTVLRRKRRHLLENSNEKAASVLRVRQNTHAQVEREAKTKKDVNCIDYERMHQIRKGKKK